MHRRWYKPEYEPYVWNKAAQEAFDKLSKNKVVIIKGGAGEGKTATARAIMKKYQEEHPDCELIELDKIDDFSTDVSASRSCLVLVDNSLGNEITTKRAREDAFDKFGRYWDTIHACIKCGEVKAIINFRRNILNKNWEALMRYKIFNKKNVVEIEVEDLKLTKSNKRELLEKHCAHNKITICIDEKDANYESEEILKESTPVRITESMAQQIVESETLIGYPRAIQMFTKDRKNTRLGMDFFKKPNQSIIDELSNYLHDRGNILESHYAVLLYMLFNDGKIDRYDIKEDIVKKVHEAISSTPRMHRIEVNDAVSEMNNKYILKDGKEDVYSFKHEIIKEAVAIVYCDAYPKHALNQLDYGLIEKYARTRSYQRKANEVILRINPDCYSLLAKRFLAERPIYSCVKHQALDDEAFVTKFFDQVLESSELIEVINNSCFRNRGMFTKACAFGKLTFVKQLWEHFSKKAAPFVHEALSSSCRFNRIESVRWLLGRGTKLSDDLLSDPVFYACRYGSLECLQCLMDYREQLHIDKVTRGLFNACFAGHVDIISYLLNFRPDITIDDKREAMSWTVVGGHVDALEYIFSSSSELANHEYMSLTLFKTTVPFLHIAAFFGRYEVFMRILTSGMLCDEYNCRVTVLQSAMYGFKHPGVDFENVSSYSLLRSDLYGHFTTGLYDAEKKFPPVSEYCQIIEYILQNPNREETKGLDMKMDKVENTLAHYCILNNTLSLLQILAQKSPELLVVPNSQGTLPIQLAVFLGRAQLVSVLLGVGTPNIPENGPSLQDLVKQGKVHADCSFDLISDKPGILNCLEENHPTVRFGNLEDFELIEKIV